MRETKIRNYRWELVGTIVGLGLYSYRVRELLASLALFAVLFSCLALAAVGAVLAWWASEHLVIWAEGWSPSVFAFSNRLITAYARSWAPNEPRTRIEDCADVNRPFTPSSPERWLGEGRPDLGTFILAGGSVIPIIDQLQRLPAKVPFVEAQVH